MKLSLDIIPQAVVLRLPTVSIALAIESAAVSLDIRDSQAETLDTESPAVSVSIED
jgi:hypothetical protein